MQTKKGFTLIELLVVIAIIGVLAAVVLVAINPAERLAQARDSGRKSDVGQIATALEAYFTTSTDAEYPAILDNLTVADLKRLPTDPTGGSYGYQGGGSDTVALHATMESDAEAAKGVTYCWRSETGAFTNEAATTGAGCTP
ncbi:MAG TPA: type II secretion system protein [Patescibacteria group bacterium]|nr:type II secretion system protein [Patescibacteria group bacterium]